MRQIINASYMYAANHEGWLVPLAYWGNGFPLGGGYNWTANPEFRSLLGLPVTAPAGGDGVLHCPSYKNAHGIGMNDGGDLYVYGDDWSGWNLGHVQQLSAAIFFTDGPHTVVGAGGDRTTYKKWREMGEVNVSHWRPWYRHNEGANAGFFDGHVKWLPYAEMARDMISSEEKWEKLWIPYPSPRARTPRYPNYP